MLAKSLWIRNENLHREMKISPLQYTDRETEAQRRERIARVIHSLNGQAKAGSLDTLSLSMRLFPSHHSASLIKKVCIIVILQSLCFSFPQCRFFKWYNSFIF